MPEKPNIPHFIKAFLGDWWSCMSGALSIPFLFLGLFNVWAQKDLFYLLAILCLLVTAYRTWAKEREKVIELTKKPEKPIDLFKKFLDKKIANGEKIYKEFEGIDDEVGNLNDFADKCVVLTNKYDAWLSELISVFNSCLKPLDDDMIRGARISLDMIRSKQNFMNSLRVDINYLDRLNNSVKSNYLIDGVDCSFIGEYLEYP